MSTQTPTPLKRSFFSSHTFSLTRDLIRVFSMVLMFAAVVVATAVGFAHSYAGLFAWGNLHKLTNWKADTFPLLVDLFILIGELGLFLLALDGEKVRKSWTSWMDMIIPGSVVAAGWSASLWFNVNHVEGATRDDKITFAIPPIAAMIGLVILLRNVHRYTSRLADGTPAVTALSEPKEIAAPEPVPAPAPAPVVRPYRLPGTPTMFRVGTMAQTIFPVPAPAAPAPVRVPVPEPVPAPEPVAPRYVPAAPAPATEPVPAPTAARNGYPVHNPKWAEGVALFRESYAAHLATGSKHLSQRELAAKLGMRNRALATQIIQFVKEEERANVPNGVPVTP